MVIYLIIKLIILNVQTFQFSCLGTGDMLAWSSHQDDFDDCENVICKFEYITLRF